MGSITKPGWQSHGWQHVDWKVKFITHRPFAMLLTPMICLDVFCHKFAGYRCNACMEQAGHSSLSDHVFWGRCKQQELLWRAEIAFSSCRWDCGLHGTFTQGTISILFLNPLSLDVTSLSTTLEKIKYEEKGKTILCYFKLGIVNKVTYLLVAMVCGRVSSMICMQVRVSPDVKGSCLLLLLSRVFNIVKESWLAQLRKKLTPGQKSTKSQSKTVSKRIWDSLSQLYCKIDSALFTEPFIRESAPDQMLWK